MRDSGGRPPEELIGDAPLLSVSQLTAQIRKQLENQFADVWVVGEISNLKYHQSGHVYFTLKDNAAQLSAVMWRTVAARLRFTLEHGMEVFAFGRITVYEPQGKYQLSVSRIMPKGMGALQLAFTQLLEKLRAEGLFEAARKKPLPEFPRRIAIVTSPTGAALRDMLRILKSRGADLDVFIYPVRVQGDGAAPLIAAAIERLNKNMPELDAMIVGRGGGSLEDLWPFNEEIVARAIAASRIPVVSGVGHEIDVTISDYAADVRAATPTEAAAIVTPDRIELGRRVDNLRSRMGRQLSWRLEAARQRVDALAERGVSQRPLEMIQRHVQRVDDLETRLSGSIRLSLKQNRAKLDSLAARLDALSPLRILDRGYSITTLADTGKVIRDASEAPAGTLIRTRVSSGQISSRVEPSGDGGK